MKKTCIQCGKEFELSDSEVSFYEGKGLELPKRCKECRKENKKNKAKRYHSRKNRKSTGGGSKSSQDNPASAAKSAKDRPLGGENYREQVRTSSVEALNEPDKPVSFLQKIKNFLGIG